ncbi:MAG: response regulator [Kofleriaceae bacterium]|nr:response regulator [Kofleriaceae bacterium]
MRILVVDDSAVMRKLVIRSLEMAGIPVDQVRTAVNGQDALVKLSEGAFDLALVDINMPIMNGIELVERIRGDSSTASLPIVIVSTEGSETRLAHLRSFSVGFVRKPFTPEDLVDAVIGAIGGENGQELAEGTMCGGGPDF